MQALLTFFQTFAGPLTVTTIGGIIYSLIILRKSQLTKLSAFTLFLTGIIVITCIFLPFNWSLAHTGSSKDLSLFFFQVNIEGSNFIASFQKFLRELQIPDAYIQNGITIFLAFLEELAKLTLLILCIKKTLRWPIILVGIVLVGTIIKRSIGADVSVNTIWTIGITGVIGLAILWYLLGAAIRTDSVADYIYSIAMVAVGFAFAENIKYMLDLAAAGETQDMIMNNALLRSIFGYLSHIFFSMVCVALYARGRFAFLRLIDNAGTLTLGQKALGWKNFTSVKSIQGFWTGVIVATIIHGIYNIYIAKDVLIPTIILVVGYLLLEFLVLKNLRNNTKYGNIEKYLQ